LGRCFARQSLGCFPEFEEGSAITAKNAISHADRFGQNTRSAQSLATPEEKLAHLVKTPKDETPT
jgi:hypothetical protein